MTLALFRSQFRALPGETPVVAISDLQVDVATDGSDQVEHAITVPAALAGSQLAVMVIAPEELLGIEEGALEFEPKISGEIVEDGAGNSLYGYAYVLAAPEAGAHTIVLTFADACTPATFLAVLSGVRADSVEGSANPEGGIDTAYSRVPVRPRLAYALAVDLIATAAPATFTPIYGQTNPVAADDDLAAATSQKGSLNRGVDQDMGWRLGAAAGLVMHIALTFESAAAEDPDPPPEEISDVAIWLLNDSAGAVANDSVGSADGVITGQMEFGVDDLVDGGDTCMAGDGVSARIVAPSVAPSGGNPGHQLAQYTLDLVAQADADPQVQEVWLSKDDTTLGGRPPGGISIERRWNGSASRLAAYTRNEGAVTVWIEDGATPDGQHGVADWPDDTAVRIHLVVEPAHATEPTRLYLDGSKVATSTTAQGLQLNAVDWSFFCFKNNATTFVAFCEGMIYRIRLRDLPLSDAEVAAEVAGEPAVSIVHGAPPAAADYDAEVAAFAADLVSYWKFQNNGVDENATQNAVITGTPEFNVETIVDLDRIAEGATANGTCIAWPGAPGIYAEVPHNAAHKTAAGSIIIHFQRDTAGDRTTLLAADRSSGGTASGAGGFSIEIEPDGSARCFLRNSGGTAVILLGTAGDVAINQAYSLVFKWGTGGFSVAIWNAAGTLVRRLTNALTDGLSGTSPIRFGAWHTNISHHDGPYGRVIWLDRRISDAEEQDLARARTITRSATPPPPDPGEFTPFPFVVISNPAVSHAGVGARPGFSPTDPRSASIIDPMSGLEIFRIGGNNGANIMINGTTDSGFNYPRKLRNENNSKGFKVWNADAGLLMIDRRFPRDGDAADAAGSYLIDVTGTHGASAPWRVLRVNPTDDIADIGGNVAWWFWDPNNPIRAFNVYSNGRLGEWWPIGGDGHSVGEVNVLYGALPAGFGNVTSADARPQTCEPTRDGVWRVMPCQRTSDSIWGGVRQNIQTGAMGPFIPTPDIGDSMTSPIRGANGVSPFGTHMGFQEQGNRHVFKRTTANVIDSDSGVNGVFTHVCFLDRDGVQYLGGVRTDNVSLWDIANGGRSDLVTEAQFQGANPNHISALNWNDRFEVYGGTGSGSATGHRYMIYVRSNARSGHPRGVLAIRCGANDMNVIRYLFNHRSVRSDNSNECHVQPSPNTEYVVFPSNWRDANANLSDDVHPYVAVIPDGFRSPNNNGSAA